MHCRRQLSLLQVLGVGFSDVVDKCVDVDPCVVNLLEVVVRLVDRSPCVDTGLKVCEESEVWVPAAVLVAFEEDGVVRMPIAEPVVCAETGVVVARQAPTDWLVGVLVDVLTELTVLVVLLV